ncbi:MAG: carboxymuconolactone decarboxylase family protein [Pseudolabrys sp.]
MPAKRPAPRLAPLTEEQMNAPQRALVDTLRSGPRGKSLTIRGPFAAWLHAPLLGDLAQKLGAHVRYHTALSPRQSEFAILCTARLWRAQYEWFAHAPVAEKAGVSLKTIADLRAGRAPTTAQKDERAIYDFIKELYRTKRVTDRTYARVRGFLNDSGMVELTGILGYYVLISMTLNVFRMLPPADSELPFPEPKAR